MAGLPQSRPAGNDQSSVTISARAPAARATSARSSSVSRSADQCTWKKSFGLAAVTSAAGLLANSLSPSAVPAARVPIATATSPSGCTAWAPTGAAMTGRSMSTPSTEVRRSRRAGSPASRGGANRIAPKAATLSARVTPASAPASIAVNTGRGSRRRARRRASATDSNQSPVDAIGTAQLSQPVRAAHTRAAHTRAARARCFFRSRSRSRSRGSAWAAAGNSRMLPGYSRIFLLLSARSKDSGSISVPEDGNRSTVLAVATGGRGFLLLSFVDSGGSAGERVSAGVSG
jgi:hypothetical protein